MDSRSPHRKQDRSTPGNKLYISNLSPEVRQDDIKTFFKRHGSPTVNIKSKSRNVFFAFLEFSTAQEATQAMNDLNQKEFMGREIRIEYARGGRGTFRGPSGGSSGYQGRPKECYVCHRPGHFARQCPQGRDRDRRRRSRERSGSGSERGRHQRSRSPDRNRKRDFGGRRRDYERRSGSPPSRERGERTHERGRQREREERSY